MYVIALPQSRRSNLAEATGPRRFAVNRPAMQNKVDLAYALKADRVIKGNALQNYKLHLRL